MDLVCSEQKGDPEDLRLQEEMREFGDILRLDVVDSYDDLSKKTLKMFTVLPQKIDAYYYFKVDDDVAVNIDAMEAFLQERKNQGNLYLVRLYSRHLGQAFKALRDSPDSTSSPPTISAQTGEGLSTLERRLYCLLKLSF